MEVTAGRKNMMKVGSSCRWVASPCLLEGKNTVLGGIRGKKEILTCCSCLEEGQRLVDWQRETFKWKGDSFSFCEGSVMYGICTSRGIVEEKRNT